MSETVSPTQLCLQGRCPRCGEGKIFANWLELRPVCEGCGLDLSKHDSGDGPAYLTICIVGGLVTVLATVTEIAFAPPYWLHMVLWGPMVLFGSVFVLHYMKAWLLAASYRHHRLGDAP